VVVVCTATAGVSSASCQRAGSVTRVATALLRALHRHSCNARKREHTHMHAPVSFVANDEAQPPTAGNSTPSSASSSAISFVRTATKSVIARWIRQPSPPNSGKTQTMNCRSPFQNPLCRQQIRSTDSGRKTARCAGQLRQTAPQPWLDSLAGVCGRMMLLAPVERVP
jgi:hypothetical protein